ncbi:MAG: hypothetical protein ACI91T_001108 [Natronomonas sp.]|jgi:hypothetical protein
MTGTALTGTLAGCSDLNLLSSETNVEYDESSLAAIPGELPGVPAATPVQPTPDHVAAARERIRLLLDDADVSRIPNEVVRQKLDREREAARAALTRDDDHETTRVDTLAGLTHPRSEAMFVHAGLAAFDEALSAGDVEARQDRHHRDAEAFLADYRYVGPPDDAVGALAEHARIVDWGQTGARIAEPNRHHEYENTVLHVAELAQDVEWGRAYAADARRLREHYASTLDDPRNYGNRFSRVADTLVTDVGAYVEPPEWEALTSEFERDVGNTAGAKLLEELARSRWSGAENAVESHDDALHALAVVAAMRAITADRAFAAATDVISDGGYGVPESVAPIAAERTAAVEGLRALLDTSPAPLAHSLARYVRIPLRNADEQVRRGSVSAPGRFLYGQYAVANRFAAAAPAVVRRVGDALEA